LLQLFDFSVLDFNNFLNFRRVCLINLNCLFELSISLLSDEKSSLNFWIFQRRNDFIRILVFNIFMHFHDWDELRIIKHWNLVFQLIFKADLLVLVWSRIKLRKMCDLVIEIILTLENFDKIFISGISWKDFFWVLIRILWKIWNLMGRSVLLEHAI